MDYACRSMYLPVIDSNIIGGGTYVLSYRNSSPRQNLRGGHTSNALVKKKMHT